MEKTVLAPLPQNRHIPIKRPPIWPKGEMEDAAAYLIAPLPA